MRHLLLNVDLNRNLCETLCFYFVPFVVNCIPEILNRRNMIRILVASRNPVKIEAVRDALQDFLNGEMEITGVSVPSGVSDQPMSEAETLQGASTRVSKSIDLHPGFDYYVGLEGGVEETASGLMAFAWMVISDGERIGKARTASFFLPPKVAELVHGGMELGDADDVVFAKTNSKQQNGAVGLLTNDVVTRKLLYLPAVQMAFIPFLNPELYP